MAYALRSKGTMATGTGSLSPGAPAGKTNGDLLVLACGVRNNSETLSAPSGWLEAGPLIHQTWDHVYIRYADGTAADTPTIDFSGTSQSAAQIAAFTGATLDISALPATNADKNTTDLNVPYPAMPMSEPNCLVLAVSVHNKTAANNGFTFAAFTGFTKIDENYDTGTGIAFWWGYQVQTTATDFALTTHTYTSSADNLQATGLYATFRLTAGGAPLRRMGRTPIGLQSNHVRVY